MVAVTVDGSTRAEIAAWGPTRHGETLLGHIERALTSAGLAIADIDLLAVGLGPGSFTGVRIGVATAKGLAVARKTPLVGVPTTRAIARGAFGTLRAPVIDAHKGEVFVALYEAGPDGTLVTRFEEAHGVPEAMAQRLRETAGEGVPVVLVGSGLAPYGARMAETLGRPHLLAPRAFDVPRGSLIALEAAERLARRGPDDAAALEPIYVRAADAVLPAPRFPSSQADR